MSASLSQARRSSRRELSRRSNGGIDVVLFWDDTDGKLTVCVTDRRDGIYFELSPAPAVALDAFQHPYSYADRAAERSGSVVADDLGAAGGRQERPIRVE
jgi:hypothetical protein